MALRQLIIPTFLLFVLVPATSAQVIRGSVASAENSAPIVGAIVEVFDSDSVRVAMTLTNPDGRFIESLESPGSYRVRVWTLGFAEMETVQSVAAGDTTSVSLELNAEPVDLPELRVAVSRRKRGRDKFALRMAEERGVFLTPQDLAQKTMYHAGDAFAHLVDEGVRLRWERGPTDLGMGAVGNIPIVETSQGRGCLRFFLNEQVVYTGQPGQGRRNQWTYYPLNTILPQDIVAVEVYRSLYEVPAEFRNTASLPSSVVEADRRRNRPDEETPWQRASIDEYTCGVVIIWTKQRW